MTLIADYQRRVDELRHTLLEVDRAVSGLPPIPDDPDVPNQVLEMFLK